MKSYNTCGICKNFKDKRRFGGLGIRKKPCINKIIGSVYGLHVLSSVSAYILVKGVVPLDIFEILK